MTAWSMISINALKEAAFVRDSFDKDMMSLVHGFLPLQSKFTGNHPRQTQAGFQTDTFELAL